jgi:hypothetical protein
MTRFSLRTLILVMLLGGPMLAAVCWAWRAMHEPTPEVTYEPFEFGHDLSDRFQAMPAK